MKILFAGRLDPFKDPLTFIKAAKHLPQHAFIIAGDGKLIGDCHREASGLRNITFYPWLLKNDLRKLRVDSDVFCQLSPVENIWAGSLIEAMKSKLPVVCTDAGYTRRFLEDGFHVLLIPPNNVQALVHAVSRLEAKVLRDFLAKNAYNYVVSNLSIGKIAAQVIGVAESVC